MDEITNGFITSNAKRQEGGKSLLLEKGSLVYVIQRRKVKMIEGVLTLYRFARVGKGRARRRAGRGGGRKGVKDGKVAECEHSFSAHPDLMGELSEDLSENRCLIERKMAKIHQKN